MSFSSEVKKELSQAQGGQPCCRKAEAYGLLQFGHGFSGTAVSLQTENAAVAERYTCLLREVCHVEASRREEESSHAVTGRAYHILSVANAADRRRVLESFGHTPADVAVRLNRANLECDECAGAYLRGAFLSCGALTDPNADYHIEFSVPYYNLSRDLLALLSEVGLPAKEVRRKGGHVIYFKESEQIEDCLTLMGASNASLELMNVKILKDIRNKANRLTNCESANIDKTVAASAVHVEAVKRIVAAGGLTLLPEELRELAGLRLENPELSLRELGVLLVPPLSRSGVNHRLRRIVEFADRL